MEVFDFKNEKNIVYIRNNQTQQKMDAPAINSINKDWYLLENTMDIKKILRVASYNGEDRGP